jgi:hypothetical protein
MGLTANLDLPYPVGTDKVANGDDAIKALADRLEAIGFVIERGVVAVPISASTPTVSSAAITYTVGKFSLAPYVMATLRAVSLPHVFSPPAVDVGNSAGSTVRVTRLSGVAATVDVAWIAFGIA